MLVRSEAQQAGVGAADNNTRNFLAYLPSI